MATSKQIGLTIKRKTAKVAKLKKELSAENASIAKLNGELAVAKKKEAEAKAKAKAKPKAKAKAKAKAQPKKPA